MRVSIISRRVREALAWSAVLIGSLVLASASAAAQAAATSSSVRARAGERVVRPAIVETRAEAVRVAPAVNQVLIDPGRLGAAAAAARESIVATDLSGVAVALQRAPSGELAIASQTDRWVVVKPERTTVQPMRLGVQWLPGVCIPPANAAEGVRSRGILTYADFTTVPVAWDTAVDAYRLVANIGVARDGAPEAGGPIGATAAIKLSIDGVSGAEPTEFKIEKLGLEGEREVTLTFARTDSAEPRLVVRSSIASEQPYAMRVLPRVDVRPRRNPILGLGLEEIPVEVECVQPHGLPARLGERAGMTVLCEGGRESEADSLIVSDDDRIARFAFRSTWIGPARITASARTTQQAFVGSVTVQQQMPWVQLATAIAGGALGGFARRFLRGSRRRAAPRRVLEGAIVGLVAFIAGVLGVGFLNLPSAIVATVAGAFLTGVLTGFAGVVVLEKLSKTTTRASE